MLSPESMPIHGFSYRENPIKNIFINKKALLAYNRKKH